MQLYEFGVFNNTQDSLSFTVFKDYPIKNNSDFSALLPWYT